MLRRRVGRAGKGADWNDDGYEQDQEAGTYWEAEEAEASYRAGEQRDQEATQAPDDGHAGYYGEDEATHLPGRFAASRPHEPYASYHDEEGDAYPAHGDEEPAWEEGDQDERRRNERALAPLNPGGALVRRSAASRVLAQLAGERREAASYLEPRQTGPMIIPAKRRGKVAPRPGALGHSPLSLRAHRPRPFLMMVAILGLAVVAFSTVALAAAPLDIPHQIVSAFNSLANFGAPASTAQVAYHWYTVHYGDSLQSIANRFGVQPGGILEMNNLQDGDQLYVGMELKIPTDPTYGATYQSVVDIPPPPPDKAGNVFGTNPWNSLSGATDPQNVCAPQGNADNQADRQAFQLIEPNPNASFARGFTWYHNGVDLDNPAGTPILAAQAGLVVFAGWDNLGLGWSVKINNCWGLSTMYGHMEHPPLVHAGDYVTVGEQIGQEGSTGNSTGPHLHFMTEWWNKPANPYCFDFALPAGNTPCTDP